MTVVYENETEAENGYWADVYYYMKENNCDKETAIKAIELIYENFTKRND